MRKYYQVIDIGNSNIEIGIYNRESLISSWRISSDKKKTEDEYFTVIKHLLNCKGVEIKDIEKIALASVVPSLTRIFTHLIDKYFKPSTLINVTPYTDMGLTFPVKDPGFIGVDLIVNAFSALNKYKDNCIICDLGTATTIQLVDKSGFFHGTVISPGVVTGSQFLFEKAALLSNIELYKPDSLLGKSTKSSLLSGIIKGSALMIDGFIKEIKNEYSGLGSIKTILTGGIAKLIFLSTKEVDFLDNHLTIDGLFFLCNNKKF